MTSLQSAALSVAFLIFGAGVGAWTASRTTGPSTDRAEAAGAESGAQKARVKALETELAAARETIGALEKQLEAATEAPAAPEVAAATTPAGPTDLNTLFQQARPLLQSLGPMLDNARRQGSKAMAERRVAELSEKYGLSADQQETIKKWFEEKSEKDAEKGRELMNNPGTNLQDVIAAGRGQQRPDDGLDEMMATTLNPQQLTAYQADRLQERAGNVEKEANRRVTQLNDVVQLDDAQQDQVFAIMARSSSDYDPAMQLEGLGSDAGALAEGSSRDDAILAVLRPEQREAYEADRKRRREEAAKNLEAIGIKPPADMGILDQIGR